MVKIIFAFETDEAAQVALDRINADQGYPKEGCFTTSYCMITNRTIPADNITIRVLSELTPEEIELKEEE